MWRAILQDVRRVSSDANLGFPGAFFPFIEFAPVPRMGSSNNTLATSNSFPGLEFSSPDSNIEFQITGFRSLRLPAAGMRRIMKS
jgi:hypothetical protein